MRYTRIIRYFYYDSFSLSLSLSLSLSFSWQKILRDNCVVIENIEISREADSLKARLPDVSSGIYGFP